MVCGWVVCVENGGIMLGGMKRWGDGGVRDGGRMWEAGGECDDVKREVWVRKKRMSWKLEKIVVSASMAW